MSFMIGMCKRIISPGIFFIFFKVLIFQVVREVKGQTVTQNDQKLFQEAYFIGSRFLVHMCKMMVSPGHTYSVTLHTQGTVDYIVKICGTQV